MTAEALLARIEGVREIGAGRWMARCPAHPDRSPSLSIRELPDGRLLLNCFAGCATPDVLAVISLKFSDLYPERSGDHHTPGVRPNHYHAARAALESLASDTLLVAIAAETLAGGVALTKADRDSLLAASGRIRAATRMAAG